MTTTAKSTSPTPASPAASKKAQDQKRMMIIGGGAVAVIVAFVALFFAFRGMDAPRLNDNAVLLSKYVSSKWFEQLPFEEQRQYYKVLDDRDEELDQAFSSGKLTESEYRAGIEAAWLGKHVNRVEKYFSLSPGVPRTNYLNKLLEKKERKKAKSKGAPNSADEINADETAAEMKVEKWPPAMRKQWEDFHEAYRAQRKAIEKAQKPATKPA